jgi:hypothetical protein
MIADRSMKICRRCFWKAPLLEVERRGDGHRVCRPNIVNRTGCGPVVQDSVAQGPVSTAPSNLVRCKVVSTIMFLASASTVGCIWFSSLTLDETTILFLGPAV